jgi:hypothetical protein
VRYESLKLDFAKKNQEQQVIIEQIEKVRTKLEALERTNAQLADQNRLLGVRAAVSFDDLTPRFKDFEAVFAHHALEKPKPEYQSLGKTSSIAFIQALIRQLRPSHPPKGKETKAETTAAVHIDVDAEDEAEAGVGSKVAEPTNDKA